MNDVLGWLEDQLSAELAEAGHAPEDPVWTAAMRVLPQWSGTLRSAHDYAHLQVGGARCRSALTSRAEPAAEAMAGQ
ncbi:hypothetical protein ODJ79_20620 [Actinoplanes sp. KI2]|uniref:hypothetical protein n=1 Tax=Actinoplanes sp. KI2 TaxID=2983315 RepID=UPI0021D59C07|nr:hypothetical protein [Actinoplanes sp. KI2]MCU7726137.1 hypothetical protein [Actinoplanes sp. KI2]